MEETKRSGKKKIVLILLLTVRLAAAAAIAIYLKMMHDRPTFLDRTIVNGFDLSGLTPEQAMEEITEKYSDSHVELLEKGQTSIAGDLASFGYTVDREGLGRLLERGYSMQRESVPALIKSVMSGNIFSTQVPFSFDMNVLTSQVNSQNLAEERVPSKDAELTYAEEAREYRMVPEVYGNELVDSDLQLLMKSRLDEFVAGNVSGNTLQVEIPEEMYIKPGVTSEDAGLKRMQEVYNYYCKAGVTYTFGSQTEYLGWEQIKPWVTYGDDWSDLDTEQISAFVEDLAARYNTRYHDRTFHSTLGYDVTIPGDFNEYGYIVDQDGEAAQLYSDIMSGAEVTREPVYYSKNDSYGNPYYYGREGRDDLAGTYVEVSISAQHLWFYKSGSLIVECDVVSGCIARGTPTQTGCFPLAYKESPSVLRGGDSGNGYATTVQYWMPFYEGQGLHDATWRGSFGGSIYQGSGSHGCVNLPYSAAETIYYNIEPGTAILIY